MKRDRETENNEAIMNLALIIFFIITMVMLIVSTAEPVHGAELIEVEATAYFEGTICADGTAPEEGLTLAGRKEWLGKTAALYISEDGLISEFLGYFEFHDTGGDSRLKDGTCIDIYMSDKDACIQWGRRKVFMMMIEAEG